MARAAAVELHTNMRVNDALIRLARCENDPSNEFPPEINDLIEDLRGQKGLSPAAGSFVVHGLVGLAVSGMCMHLNGSFGADGTQELALLCGNTGARPAPRRFRGTFRADIERAPNAS
jgi:hypothetical protein